VVPAASGGIASGKVDGIAMTGSETGLVAPSNSSALGLILKVGGAVASATVTVDFGLGGALQSIRDTMRARTGPIANAQDRLQREATAIAKDRETMETRYEAYYNQLVASFSKMESRVSAFKATQSYLEQQIDAWNSND
jgi:flagellar hook-associated protein 2